MEREGLSTARDNALPPPLLSPRLSEKIKRSAWCE